MWVDEPMEEVELGVGAHDVTPPPVHLGHETSAASAFAKRGRHDAFDVVDDDMMHDRIKRLNIGREGASQLESAWQRDAKHAHAHHEAAREHAAEAAGQAPNGQSVLASGAARADLHAADEANGDAENLSYHGINQLLARMHVERESRRRAAYEALVRMGVDPALIPIRRAESDDDL